MCINQAAFHFFIQPELPHASPAHLRKCEFTPAQVCGRAAMRIADGLRSMAKGGTMRLDFLKEGNGYG